MSITKYCLTRKIAVPCQRAGCQVQPLATQSASESDRLEKLERAVEQLQKRNAELEAEVSSLKKQTAVIPDGKLKTKVISRRKNVCRASCSCEQRKRLFTSSSGDRN